MANLNLSQSLTSVKPEVVELIELGGGVVQITMKDEENRNTFSPGIIDGLSKCFSIVAQEKSYKVVILTGYGNYFCSGGTREELVKIHQKEIQFNELDFFRILLDCKIPVIAAMQGHGIGGGFIFGLYADLVVLSKESIYTTNFMKYGFTPGFGCTFVVPEKLGSVLGQEMMYTAKNYRGEELAERGIAFPVLPRKEVLNFARKTAYEMAEKPRLSLITLKKSLTLPIKSKLPEFISKEVAMHEVTFHQPEVADRIKAVFGEKATVDGEVNHQHLIRASAEAGIQKNSLNYQPNKGYMVQQEEILSRLQSGDISLENAEQQILWAISQKNFPAEVANKQIDNARNKITNPHSSEKILSLLSVGELSLENAEYLLLDTVEPAATVENFEIASVQNTDIAIIGISCRYPGANNWQEFWEILKNGSDCVIETPPDRWKEKNWYHPDPEHPGTSYAKYAGFLDDIDQFDPLFFKISPEEAQFIEPQQRIFLEEAYHAIEDAGYAADSLKSKQCGVFVGATASGDYSKLLSTSELDTHRLALTGNLLSALPARIAYFLDLKGPVLAIDTACSSSLVAVHQACESIRRGESELAIAGGIATMLSSNTQVLSSQFQMVSASGRCKTFDAEASGTVWSEGCGIVLLKSYDQAIKDKDHIYGVIKGTGVNYDGNTNGISAPSSKSQTQLEEGVYQKFGINPETISYVEAHGTATPLGDPIEVEALTEAFSKWTDKKQFCAIGAVKTNIGHPAYAAGVAGLIKTILCLKNQKLVPSLNFNQPNPHIDFENSPFYVNTEFKDWSVINHKPRRAAVNSFGFSGTNAHVVIEESSVSVKSQVEKSQTKYNLERSLHLLTLSAKTKKALEELVVDYHNYLKQGDGKDTRVDIDTLTHNSLETADVCYTANTGRNHFQYRLVVLASSQQELTTKLLQCSQGQKADEILIGAETLPVNNSKIAFIFTGQGSQYVGMGQQLYETQPTFKKALDRCAEILNAYLDKPLIELLYGSQADELVLAQTCYAQPALFALEYALYQLWQSWGIKPSWVMGHSVGEYVAACVAGVFSLEDGLRLISTQGKLRQQLPLTESMLAEFELVANQVSYYPPQLEIISQVIGKVATEEIATPEYWVRHIQSPVNFKDSMNTLHQQGCEVFIECGSKPILLGMGRQCLPESKELLWLPSLRPGQEDWQQMLISLAELYVRGVKVNWQGFDRDYPQRRRVIGLPTYPFQRQRYWVDSDTKPSQIEQEASSSEVFKSIQEGNVQALLQQLQSSNTFSEESSPSQVLKDLIELHHQQSAQSLLSDLLFQVDWQAQCPLAAANLPAGQWLILTDHHGLGTTLADRLREQRHQCHLLTSDSSAETVEKIRSFITQLHQDDELPFYGIIYLWSWNNADEELPQDWDWQTSLQSTVAPLLDLVQVMSKLAKDPPKLWVVTRQAQTIGSVSGIINQTPLWGLGRVILQEHPELWGGLIDLEDSQNLVESAQQILTEIFQEQGIAQVAYRQGNRYLPRLVRSQQTPPRLKLSSEHSYLISGGLGGLGLQIARSLVEQGVRHLILLGRRGVTNEDQKQSIADFAAAGTQVHVETVDVSQWQELKQKWTAWSKSIPLIKGVIHAAGVLDDGLLQDQSWQRFTEVMNPKVQGSWNLHWLTQDRELDFFICFSSAAVLLGNAAQSNYATANAFLDGLCAHRRCLGLPGLSINWSAWSEVGMAANLSSALKIRLAQTGLKLISPEQGLQIFKQQLGRQGQIGAIAFDWEALNQRLKPSQRAFFAEVLPEKTANTSSTPKQDAALQRRLATVAQTDRKNLLRQILQEEVSLLLGLPATDKPSPQIGFFDLGMDSLMTVELRIRLSNLLGKNLPSTLTFDFPNIEKLEKYLIDEYSIPLGLLDKKNETEEELIEVSLLAEIESSSEQELENSIDQILESINF